MWSAVWLDLAHTSSVLAFREENELAYLITEQMSQNCHSWTMYGPRVGKAVSDCVDESVSIILGIHKKHVIVVKNCSQPLYPYLQARSFIYRS